MLPTIQKKKKKKKLRIQQKPIDTRESFTRVRNKREKRSKKLAYDSSIRGKISLQIKQLLLAFFKCQ
jgi:hypothetical protein